MKNYFIIILTLQAFCLNVGAQEKQKGRVVDAQTQEPLAGAIVKVLEPAQTVTTNNEGYFELALKKGKYQFQIQYLGYAVRDTTLSVPSSIRISLRANSSQLNEVQITGYGQTTKRLATGSISSINAAELERQPITNVLSALAGRMPGVIVQTTNGLPGGNINVQIRGRGSIGAGTAPLYIIDGVPFDGEAPNAANSQIGYNSINGAISPLNNLNPTDIEQISVLQECLV
ncbi:MAG: TonB-dependent receptor plug domain-containing protein [Gammaproteobacteria bacterium]|nr:TonB-dependent receptor plug domain-containing protein [Gammaproteobacteria bacterium]